jgi:hypothetical protein
MLGSRPTNIPSDSSPDPAEQFTQHNRAATEEDNDWPGFPHQSMYELVKLRIGHIHPCCEFRAKHVRRSFGEGGLSG